MKAVKYWVLASILLLSTAASNAGVITGGDLLDDDGATLLEGFLGIGDQDFTNIANLDVGATAASWHALVDSYNKVISIYDVTFNGENFLIGGYTSVGHASSGYNYDENAFIFNLTLDIVAFEDPAKFEHQAIYNNSNEFATFGGGNDLYGGESTLGTFQGFNWAHPFAGSNGYSYVQSAGGLFGVQGAGENRFTVNGLESFIFADAVQVSEPSIFTLFGACLAFALVRRKARKLK